MGYSSLLSFSLGFLLLFHCSFAQIEQVVNSQQRQQQQRFQTQCQIQNLNALEPKRRIESEAGVTEFWDQNEEQLQCANVAVFRHTIQSRGLLVPSYNNDPELVYVVAFMELYSQVVLRHSKKNHSHSHSHSAQDQKGVSNQENSTKSPSLFWSHLRTLAIPRTSSTSTLGRSRSRSRSRSQSSRRGQQGQQSNNILSAFDEEILAQSFNIDTQLARRLQKEKRQRGIIVRVQEDLEVLSPHRQGQEQEYEEERERRQRNGLEETFCTMTLTYNINDPSRADVYNPRGGRVSSVNALNLPILRFLQLSAKKGVLHRDAILAPHWNVNAHSIVYITRGNGRIQIVSENGESVFDGEIREGQLVVVPQNFAVVKRAGSDKFEWVSFKTNGLSQTSQLAGRVSVFRALPLDVIRNSFDISREDARRLKESRSETTIFAPGSSSQREGETEEEGREGETEGEGGEGDTLS
ncbi:hypothetical protein Patl1_25601 [Pistacia atlantica]|uniref:Uncharacterized protein n=1 Tax=Pistacia atlantica TaxID=434234 RepID=A0ACC1AZN3_9ROSI|nr:hypothetical protein Patl1_25601 [Pistacia atlantica]